MVCGPNCSCWEEHPCVVKSRVKVTSYDLLTCAALEVGKNPLNGQFLEMQGVCVSVGFVSRERGSVVGMIVE